MYQLHTEAQMILYSDDPWYAMYNATLGFVQAELAIPEN